MWRILRRGLAVVGGALLVLAGVLVVIAWRSAPDEHSVPPAAPMTIDADAAAGRLGAAVRFRTIAKVPGEPLDPQSFRDLHAFLERSYPAVHKTLRPEII